MAMPTVVISASGGIEEHEAEQLRRMLCLDRMLLDWDGKSELPEKDWLIITELSPKQCNTVPQEIRLYREFKEAIVGRRQRGKGPTWIPYKYQL